MFSFRASHFPLIKLGWNFISNCSDIKKWSIWIRAKATVKCYFCHFIAKVYTPAHTYTQCARVIQPQLKQLRTEIVTEWNARSQQASSYNACMEKFSNEWKIRNEMTWHELHGILTHTVTHIHELEADTRAKKNRMNTHISWLAALIFNFLSFSQLYSSYSPLISFLWLDSVHFALKYGLNLRALFTVP